MKSGKLSFHNSRNGILLVSPMLFGFAVFYGVPVVMVVHDSLYSGMGDSARFVELANYRSILNNSVFVLALKNSMRFLLIALPLALILAFAIALFLKRKVKKHPFLKSVLMLPYVMPVAGTVLLVELLFGDTGAVNQMLDAFGIPIVKWLNSGNTFWIVMGLYLWKNTGYAVILLLSGLVTIPDAHYASASLDGANAWQQLYAITIPQMWYSIFFAGVFSLINAFKCFREIIVIGGEHPHSSLYMLQHFINNVFKRPNYGKLTVAAAIFLLILTVLFSFGYRWVMKKEAFR